MLSSKKMPKYLIFGQIRRNFSPATHDFASVNYNVESTMSESTFLRKKSYTWWRNDPRRGYKGGNTSFTSLCVELDGVLMVIEGGCWFEED